MSILSVFMVSFTIALSGALAPGPLLTTVIAQSIRHGAKSGPLIILGHAVLEAVMMGLIMLGLTPLVSDPSIMRVISLAGALVLFYFGVQLLWSIPRLSLETTTSPASKKRLVLLGVTVSLSNPYWTIWWLTIGLGLVLAAGRQGWLAVAVFFFGHVAADLAWYSIISLGISRGKRFISDKVYRVSIVLCAVALIGFAVYFALTASL